MNAQSSTERGKAHSTTGDGMREALRTVQLARLNGLFDAAIANQINGDVDGVFAEVDAALSTKQEWEECGAGAAAFAAFEKAAQVADGYAEKTTDSGLSIGARWIAEDIRALKQAADVAGEDSAGAVAPPRPSTAGSPAATQDAMELLNDLRRTAEEVSKQFDDCGGHYEYTGSMNAVEDMRDAVRRAREFWIERMP